MRRLYIGGLGNSVTQKDLKDRFGKFGDVEDVELRTKRDEEGVPFKTFAYININISDADLKKCMTVLNKSKWKGGTLQIETAKESFLHKLAEERQVAKEQSLRQPEVEDKRQKMLDSLSKAGVDNFTMRAAVPGTEVPGHKDWVVSKFGRVLPVLQLQCKKGNKARTLKYDPSKYSHNIRRINQAESDTPTPVSHLTWEVEGGDDDISKKRRGEFPPYQPPRPKKRWTDIIDSQKAVGTNRSQQKAEAVNHIEKLQINNRPELHNNHKPFLRNPAPFTGSDGDSDEEIRRLVSTQSSVCNPPGHEEEEDNLEVVGFDYLVKSGLFHRRQKGQPDDEDEDGYDSAGTDELFASRKPAALPSLPGAPLQEKQTLTTDKPPSENGVKVKKTPKKDQIRRVEETGKGDTRKSSEAEKKEECVEKSSQKQECSSNNRGKKKAALPELNPSSSELDEEEDEEGDESQSADSCSDSEYEAMFTNATCMEISFTDLQRLVEEAQQTSESTVASTTGTRSEKETDPELVSAKQRAPKKGTTPEEILASIMGQGDSSDEEEPKKKKKKVKQKIITQLPAFQGTKTLKEKSDADDNEEENGVEGSVSNQSQESKKEEEQNRTVNKIVTHKAPENNETAPSSSSDDEEVVVRQTLPSFLDKAKCPHSSSSSSSSDEDGEEEEDENVSAETAEKLATPPTPSSESSSEEEDEEEKVTEKTPSRVNLGAKEEEELQKKANLRRLAAIQQRQKEAEENKKLIQGALANLDTPTTGKKNHIVFGSDDDEEEEDEQPTPSEIGVSKTTLFSESEEETTSDEESAEKSNKDKAAAPQLFGGSDGEEDEEEEESRFEIRPQFEGRAGQRLMELQSRFGTDERFRMDSRFLEDVEDEAEESGEKNTTTEDKSLEEEKEKSLSILQSVLGTIQQPSSSKTAVKAKTFRDVSGLHYDPSKEEHAVFENKPSETKESKSARRKKREEALKLPEVSKEIYYDVSGDLKAVFGQTQTENVTEVEEEKMNWDQEEEEEEVEEAKKDEESTSMLAQVSAEEKVESGFKFSFFGNDTETEEKSTEEYKVETIQAPKVSWQQDRRFQDSSSEEEEEEDEEEQQQNKEETREETSATHKTSEEVTPLKTSLFFFYPEDSRLTEGPKLFRCSTQLEEQREQWEERRNELRQEYRKKHKDACKKLKSSMKS